MYCNVMYCTHVLLNIYITKINKTHSKLKVIIRTNIKRSYTCTGIMYMFTHNSNTCTIHVIHDGTVHSSEKCVQQFL